MYPFMLVLPFKFAHQSYCTHVSCVHVILAESNHLLRINSDDRFTSTLNLSFTYGPYPIATSDNPVVKQLGLQLGDHRFQQWHGVLSSYHSSPSAPLIRLISTHAWRNPSYLYRKQKCNNLSQRFASFPGTHSAFNKVMSSQLVTNI